MPSFKIPLMAGIKMGWISGQNFLKNWKPGHFPFGIDWIAAQTSSGVNAASKLE